MKRRISLVLTLIAVLSFIFALPITSNAISKKTVSEKKNYKVNNVVVLKYKCKKDVLRGNNNAIKKINKSINRIKNETKNEYLEHAKECYYQGAEALPHSLNISVKAYNSGDYYSFKFSKDGYWGGSHTGHDVLGYTFNKNTGKSVSALSMIKDKDKLLSKIKKAFYNKIEKTSRNPDSTYNWLGIEDMTLDNYTYYLNGKYIYVSLNFGSVLWLTGTVKVKKC